MASADWMKMTMPHAAGAMKNHLGAEERMNCNHENQNIDKSKSHLNFTVGCSDYKESVKMLRSRVKEVDKLYPPKRKVKVNERVVCENIEIKCPQEITDMGYDTVKEYFQGAYKVLQNFFGSENVCGGIAHIDEIHEYTDKDGKKRISLPHMTTLVAAYAEWNEKNKKTGEITQRRGINGKHFETKSRYNKLNRAIDDYCLANYGVRYTKGKGKDKNPDFGQSVEELKAAEKLHQITAQANEQEQRRIREQEKAAKAQEERKAAEEEVETLNAELERKRAAAKNYLDAIEIPPFNPKPYPPKPKLPEKYQTEPVNAYPNYSSKFRNFDKELEKWRKNRDKEQGKIDKEYEKTCATIDRDNENARKEWENRYATVQQLQSVAAAQEITAQEQAKTAARLRAAEDELQRGRIDRASIAAVVEQRVQKALSKAQAFVEYTRTSSHFNSLFAKFIGNGTNYDEMQQLHQKKQNPVSLQEVATAGEEPSSILRNHHMKGKDEHER